MKNAGSRSSSLASSSDTPRGAARKVRAKNLHAMRAVHNEVQWTPQAAIPSSST